MMKNKFIIIMSVFVISIIGGFVSLGYVVLFVNSGLHVFTIIFFGGAESILIGLIVGIIIGMNVKNSRTFTKQSNKMIKEETL